jgi:hypothetical protein
MVSLSLSRGASSSRPRSFTKQVAGNADYREAPPLFRMRLKIRLDEYFDRLFARVDFNANRRIAKIHFVSATILSPDDGVRHFRAAPDKSEVATAASCPRSKIN